MLQVNVDQAKTQLETLLQAVLDGEEVIVLQDERPVVKLVPYTEARQRRAPGSAKGKIVMSPDFNEPLEDFAEYMQ